MRLANTTEMGNQLEDSVYEFLCKQKEMGNLIYGTYPPELCKIYKKRDYFCPERENFVNFDVVIELYREGSSDPTQYIIFECKNHRSPIQEREITDASDKIGRLFRHNAKGVIVSTSGLQSGAENIARKRGMAIVKYDVFGLDVIADRGDVFWPGSNHLKEQIYGRSKSLRFSGYFDGRFFGSFSKFIACLDPNQDALAANRDDEKIDLPYVSDDRLERLAYELRSLVDYQNGQVDLEEICSAISIDLVCSGQQVVDSSGRVILGTANFSEKSIQLNSHNNTKRERFTLAHEIGHFYLNHGDYLGSDIVAENDLLVSEEGEISLNYQRLEFQANAFASSLLLPREQLGSFVQEWVKSRGWVDKGHGSIFVDDQPCNYGPYNDFLAGISEEFGCSFQAIEIRLAKLGLVNDARRRLIRPKSFIG